MGKEFELSRPEGHTRVQWAVAITASLTLLTFGLQTGWVSPTTKILKSSDSPMGRPLTDAEISWLASVPSMAAMFGIILMVYTVDSFGRKYAVILTAFCQLVCWIIKICPSNYASLVVARIFSGIGAAGCFQVIPMYVKEISQDNIRGTLGAMAISSQNVGILIIYSIAGYLDYYTVLYLVVGIPVLTILIMLKAPESPCYLVKVNKPEEAAATVAFLRGLDVKDQDVQNAIESIQREDEYFKSVASVSLLNVFKVKAWRRGIIVMLLICVVRALNGCLVIINFASVILENFDVQIEPQLQSLGVPVFLLVAAWIGMGLIDKLGRKILLGAALIITTLAFFVCATALLLNSNGWVIPGWIPTLALLLTVSCYGGAVSPIPSIVMSELFNFQIRGKAMAAMSGMSWFLSFFPLVLFTAISNSFGYYTSFYIFGAVNMFGVIVVILLLPETKGKSVEQIEEQLVK